MRKDESVEKLTPYQVSAVVERKQSGRQLARPHHGRQNNFAPVVDTPGRDWHFLGSRLRHDQ